MSHRECFGRHLAPRGLVEDLLTDLAEHPDSPGVLLSAICRCVRCGLQVRYVVGFDAGGDVEERFEDVTHDTGAGTATA